MKELLALLKENQVRGGKELPAAIGQVSEMEKQLAEAVGELKTMRQDLVQMLPGSIIGMSGIGKSTVVEKILSLYPQ